MLAIVPSGKSTVQWRGSNLFTQVVTIGALALVNQ
jgi:hypothetical protein